MNILGDVRDVSYLLPRHVGSRVMVTDQGNEFWRPATDVFETDQQVIIHCDLPGVPKQDIHLDVDAGLWQLTIHGEHRGHLESATSRLRERNIGKFRKIVYLPANGVDLDQLKASFANGLLEITVPKLKPTTVTIS